MAQPNIQDFAEIEMNEHLHSLRDRCLIAFGNYAQEAQKTCELFDEMEESESLDRLFAILEQTQIEEQAQTIYLRLRQQLFEKLCA